MSESASSNARIISPIRTDTRRIQCITLLIRVFGWTIAVLMIALVIANVIYAVHREKDAVHPLFRITHTETDAEYITRVLAVYHEQNACYPTTEQGLAALVSRPTIAPIPPRWRQLQNYLPGPDKDSSILEYSSDGKTFQLRTVHPTPPSP